MLSKGWGCEGRGKGLSETGRRVLPEVQWQQAACDVSLDTPLWGEGQGQRQRLKQQVYSSGGQGAVEMRTE